MQKQEKLKENGHFATVVFRALAAGRRIGCCSSMANPAPAASAACAGLVYRSSVSKRSQRDRSNSERNQSNSECDQNTGRNSRCNKKRRSKEINFNQAIKNEPGIPKVCKLDGSVLLINDLRRNMLLMIGQPSVKTHRHWLTADRAHTRRQD